MKTKTAILGIGIFALSVFCSAPVAAETVQAKVISKQPMYTSSTVRQPKTVCSQEPVFIARGNGHGYYERGFIDNVGRGIFGSTEGLVGGVIGGLIGNEIGQGRGNDIATTVGVILGSQIGNNHAPSQMPNNRITKNVCQTVYEYVNVTNKNGWIVVAEVNGRMVELTTPYEPSDYIMLNVQTSYRLQ